MGPHKAVPARDHLEDVARENRQSAQCRTLPPSKNPPSRTGVRLGAIVLVSPSQNSRAGSARIAH